MLQRTLILLKPDAVQRRLVGELTKRFESKGLRLAGLKLLQCPRATADSHYAVHKGKPFYESLLWTAYAIPRSTRASRSTNRS